MKLRAPYKFCKTLLLVLFIVSCKKKDADEGDTRLCERTMAAMTGSYHITRLESVSTYTGAAQDVTFYLTSCDLSAIYKFNIDSTFTYSESSNCNNNGIGVWWTSEFTFYTYFTSGTGNRISDATSIKSWDCTNLVLLTSFPSVDSNYRYTLIKL